MHPRDDASPPIAIHRAGRQVRSTVDDVSVCRRRQVLSTIDCRLSLFILHSPTVGVSWPNFLSPDFETKFQREVPLFLELLKFLQSTVYHGSRRETSTSVRSVQYVSIPACDRQTDRQTDRHTTTADTRASIASRG